MGLFRRLSIILKSLTRSKESYLDRLAAEAELREPLSAQKASRELDEALDALQATPKSPTPSPRISPLASSKLAADYRLLGLEVDADLETVEEAWRKLASRADPKRFPAGSEEEKRAAEILRSLNESYARIRESLNPTEGRFGQLEL